MQRDCDILQISGPRDFFLVLFEIFAATIIVNFSVELFFKLVDTSKIGDEIIQVNIVKLLVSWVQIFEIFLE